jgi:hypothetical protein
MAPPVPASSHPMGRLTRRPLETLFSHAGTHFLQIDCPGLATEEIRRFLGIDETQSQLQCGANNHIATQMKADQ